MAGIAIEHEESDGRGAFFVQRDGARHGELTYSRLDPHHVIVDHTEVSEVVPERQLVLRARAWLFGKAEIALTLEPTHDGGTRITMAEHVVEGPYALVPDRVQEELVLPRNQECLRRLVLLAEGATE